MSVALGISDLAVGAMDHKLGILVLGDGPPALNCFSLSVEGLRHSAASFAADGPLAVVPHHVLPRHQFTHFLRPAPHTSVPNGVFWCCCAARSRSRSPVAAGLLSCLSTYGPYLPAALYHRAPQHIVVKTCPFATCIQYIVREHTFLYSRQLTIWRLTSASSRLTQAVGWHEAARSRLKHWTLG